jgi:hypothetical protein
VDVSVGFIWIFNSQGKWMVQRRDTALVLGDIFEYHVLSEPCASLAEEEKRNKRRKISDDDTYDNVKI